MRLIVTRDSVAAGDDVDAPHRLELEFSNEQSIFDALRHVLQLNYLPPICGGEATWSAVSSISVAVLAQQWPNLKPLVRPTVALPDLDVRADGLHLHFNYHAQMDPDIVFDELQKRHC